MKIVDAIGDFSNWCEHGNGWDGQYIYPIAAKCAYEIIVLYHYLDTDIHTAKANLYCIGLWHSKDNGNYLERELLGCELPIQELVKIAQEDYRKTHKDS